MAKAMFVCEVIPGKLANLDTLAEEVWACCVRKKVCVERYSIYSVQSHEEAVLQITYYKYSLCSKRYLSGLEMFYERLTQFL